MAAESDGAFVSLPRVAKKLGFSPDTLSAMARADDVFRPALEEVPTRQNLPSIRKHRYYHRRQVELIEAVLAGGMDRRTALLEWTTFRNRLGVPADTAVS